MHVSVLLNGEIESDSAAQISNVYTPNDRTLNCLKTYAYLSPNDSLAFRHATRGQNQSTQKIILLPDKSLRVAPVMQPKTYAYPSPEDCLAFRRYHRERVGVEEKDVFITGLGCFCRQSISVGSPLEALSCLLLGPSLRRAHTSNTRHRRLSVESSSTMFSQLSCTAPEDT